MRAEMGSTGSWHLRARRPEAPSSRREREEAASAVRRGKPGPRVGLLLALLLSAAPAAAQRSAVIDARPGDTIRVTPEGRYEAGPLHRLLLGSHNRELWGTPMRVPVLDLDTFAGGLTPIRQGGGLQTRSLRFQGADGLVYNFRSIDKDATRSLDPVLRRTVAGRVLQDQISALLPVGALVVAPLLEAAGVLHADPLLVVLPADDGLGEFRETFEGLLGFLEVRPDEGPDGEPGFAGSTRVTGSPRFLELMEEDPRHRVDAPAYLRARLLDVYVGDWDRHPDQWRWAEFDEGGTSRWEPIPRDRDWALARLNGVLVWAASWAFPHYKGFDLEYHDAFNHTWSGRALDRTLLSGLSREEWDVVVQDLAARLTDDVIESAVRQLPESYFTLVGAELTRSLINRRDQLPRIADEFYRLLAGWVDIEGTDRRDRAVVTRLPGGDVRVEIFDARRSASPDPYFRRTFLRSETKEVRIHLLGNDDEAVVRGEPGPGILVRILGGGSDDVLRDEVGPGGAPAFFYDDRGDNEFHPGSNASVDQSEWEEPFDPESTTHQAPARDWGARTIPVPYVEFQPDLGLFLGGGFIRWGYGFRHYPSRTRLQVSAGVGVPSGVLRGAVDWQFPAGVRGLWGHLRVSASGAEVSRFYGLGNDTSNEGPRERFKAERAEVAVDALLEVRPAPGLSIAAGPAFRLLRPETGTSTLVEELDPYGFGDFEQVGFLGEVFLDRRDHPFSAIRGGYVRAAARVFPEALDVTSAFAGVRGEAATYLSPPLPLDPTLALRVGGEKLWGEVPFYEAAYLGSGSDLRGYSTQRFAGDASVFGNAELRLFLTDFFLVLPGELGVFGLADAGRVYLDGESPGGWHEAFGGGVWVAFLKRTNVVSVAVARGDERVGVYFRAGFGF